MSNPIRDAEKRTRRYWTEDGLPDLYIGLGFMIYAVLIWWSAQSDVWWQEIIKAAFPIAMISGGRFVVKKNQNTAHPPANGLYRLRFTSQTPDSARFSLESAHCSGACARHTL